MNPYDIGQQVWDDYCVSVGLLDAPEPQFTDSDRELLREMGIAEESNG